MKWGHLRTAAMILLGMLAISTIIITSGRQSSTTWPSVSSTRPSGTAALSELMKSEGWSVEVDRSHKPKAGDGELVVAFVLESAEAFTSQGEDDEVLAYVNHLREIAKSGATVVILPVSRLYDQESQDVVVEEVSASFAADYKAEVTTRSYAKKVATQIGYELPAGRYAAFSTASGSFVEAAKLGEGSLWVVRDGIGATNRFLDQAQNAEFYSALLTRLAGGSREIRFAEAGFGNAEAQSLLTVMGPWAKAFQWQAILLLLVVIFTLGRRFGKAEIDPERQRTTRDLLIAAGHAMQRGKHGQLALDMLYRESMDRVRNACGALQTESDADVLHRLPPDLTITLKRVGGMPAASTSKKEMIAAIEAMNRQVDAFCRTYRGGRARP